MTSEPSAAFDDSGIRLTAEVTEVVDVYFDERRTWSVDPVHFRPGPDGMRSVPWPSVLKPRLRGSTTVSIRKHLTQEVLLSKGFSFDGSTESLQLVDEDGNWLTVTKWGALVAAFAELTADDRRALAAEVTRLLDTINTGTPLSAFAAYGTLLGAVRTGKLMGHDHDADIGYLSDADNPADLLRHSYALQRYLRRQGWQVVRKASGWLTVTVELPSGRAPHIDIFSAHVASRRFYLERWVCAELDTSHIVPLGEVELEGVTLAAPRSPATVLAATYGESWAIPDPSFKYKLPPSVNRHFLRWVGKGGGMSDRRRWERYHEATPEPSDRRKSAFAEWVLSRLPDGAAVMDLGCGTGHDAASYAAAGHDVLGVDYSPTAVAMALEHTVDDPAVTVETFSLLDLRRLLSRGTRFALDHPGPRAVTGRLVLDALPADARNHVWWLSRTVLLGNGGSLFLEVRTHDGVPSGHRDGAPWQTQVGSERLAEEVTAHGGHVEEVADVPAPKQGKATRLTGTTRLRVSWPERC
jgi:hypothetical protein